MNGGLAGEEPSGRSLSPDLEENFVSRVEDAPAFVWGAMELRDCPCQAEEADKDLHLDVPF